MSVNDGEQTTEAFGRAAAAFYFDLASPHCYLAAERILHELPVTVPWQPVLGRDLGCAPGAVTATERARLERRARDAGLQALRWPPEHPFDSEAAMLAATFASSIGRGVAFAQAAFRQAFAGGRSLATIDNVLIAAAACEMHPRALVQALASRRTRAALDAATAHAHAAGIRALPAIVLDSRIFAGANALERAALYVDARMTEPVAT